MKLSVPDYISSIKSYVPGKPIEELEREYGIQNSIKIASNENPIGPSPMAVEAIDKAIQTLHRYPDGSAYHLIKKLAKHLNVSEKNIVLGNGSDDLIGMLSRVFLQPGDDVIIPHPSFSMYEIAVQCTGAAIKYVPLKDLGLDLDAILKQVTDKTRMVFVCNPNNPTGSIITQAAFDDFLSQLPPKVLVVVDEAYIEFVRDPNCLHSIAYANSGKPVVTLRTFSKAYGLAGLRVGYGIMSTQIANLLNRVRMPFNTSLLAQAGACAALDDQAFLEKTLEMIHNGLDFLYGELEKMGVAYFSTQANFFLIDVKRPSQDVFEAMLGKGVIVRSMHGYGFPKYIRINTGTPEENQRFIAALKEVLI